ncbi:MAG: cytochrome c oxidase subunit II [Halobacteriaceae archaeon]
MQWKRSLGPLSVAVVALVAVATSPAAAQSTSSVTEKLIWGVNNNLLAVAIPITVLVEGILFYTVWKFRNSDEAKPTQENRRLEVTWTITTALVLLFVGVTAYGAMASDDVITTQEDAQEAIESGNPAVVEVDAYQWGWQFNYDDGPQEASTLVLPTDRTVVLELSSRNVIHSFHAPELGLKKDSFPGQKTYIKTTLTEEGTYTLYCAEFCGAGHSGMLATIEVVDQETYNQWLQDPENTTL